MISQPSSGRFQAKFTIRDTDPMVREHRVLDIHILPGVVLIELVYKLLRAAKFEIASVQLESIAFHEPVVTGEAVGRKINVAIDWSQASQRGQVRVTSTAWKDDQQLGSTQTTHMSCGIEAAANHSDHGAPARSERAIEDVASCYSVTRHIGIFHDGFMQCSGSVSALEDGGCVGNIRLSERAQQHVKDFVVQPILIDCSTVVSLFHLRDRMSEASLFMPVAVDKFWSSGLDAPEAKVVVEAPGAYDATQDLIHQTFRLLDASGRVVTRVQNFSAKRVRSLDGVRGLLERHLRPLQPVAEALSAAPVAAGTLTGVPAAAPHGEDLESMVAVIAAQIVRQTEARWSDTDVTRPFFELGLDSVQLLDICEALERELSIELYPTLLFERPNVAALADYLLAARRELGAAKTIRGAVVETASPPAAETASNPVFTREQTVEPCVLVPRWLPVPGALPMAPGKLDLYRVARVAALFGSASQQSRLEAELKHALAIAASGPSCVTDFEAALDRGLCVEELWLFEFDTEQAFALAQVLVARKLVQAPFRICLVTFDGYRVHSEPLAERTDLGVWGLMQSVSREYPATRVAQIDLAQLEWPFDNQLQVRQLMDRLLLATGETRALRAVRGGRSYERKLLEVKLAATESRPLWRRQGVYLVLGGASGVGRELVRYLQKHYDARVVVLGRRPQAEVCREAEALDFGTDANLMYVTGNVDKAAELRSAIGSAISHFGALHGIVHSAMVLEDRRLAEMDNASLERVLTPKVHGARALERATEGLALDCIVFFSSIQSWVGNATQANYAAASTGMDGIAARLQARRDYPVVTVNWGYFGNVGVVADPRYRELMERQGVHALHTDTALLTLDRMLAARFAQVAILSAEEAVLVELGLDRTCSITAAPSTTTPLAAMPAIVDLETALELEAATAQGTEAIVHLARRRLVTLLPQPDVTAATPELQRWLTAVQPELYVEGNRIAISERAFRAELQSIAGEYPSVGTLVPLLTQCVEACPALLSGELQPASVVFPNGCLSLVQSVYGQNPVSAFYNRVVADTVCALARRADGRAVRILEVGAGTGATTEAVVEALRAQGIAFSYVYTDIWDKLVNQARDRFASLAADIQFRFLDVGVAPRLQGFNQPFDIVIATNVVHATRDLHRSVRHINNLLVPGGSLVLNESVSSQAYSTYTFGLLPGWWAAADEHERFANSPLTSTETWQRILCDEGFASVQPRLPKHGAGAQQVLVAQSSGEQRTTETRVEVSVVPPVLSELPAAVRGKLTLKTRGRTLDTFLDNASNTWLFLNNPPANTFSDELLEELCKTLESLQTGARSASTPHLTFLCHYGEYFSLGGDRSELVQHLAKGDHAALRSFAAKAKRLLELITSETSLVIAVADGTAQGGGFETLIAADLQLVKRGVRVGLPEVKSGLIPGMGGLSYLQSLLGSVATKRLVLTGELIDADEARQMGLISHVVDEPYLAAVELARDMTHLTAALAMKRILAAETRGLMTADIDAWVQYLVQHSQSVDTRRIANSRHLLIAKADAGDKGRERPPVERAAL